jgi:hypothetical protein
MDVGFSLGMEQILEKPNANNIANFAFNTARTWFINNDFGAQNNFISMLEVEERQHFQQLPLDQIFSLTGPPENGGRPRMRKRWLSKLLKGGGPEDVRKKFIAKFLHFMCMLSLVIVFVIAYNTKLIDPRMCDSIFYQLGGHLFQSSLQNQYCAYYGSFRKLLVSITDQTQKARTPQELIVVMPVVIAPIIAAYTGIIKAHASYKAAIEELAGYIGTNIDRLPNLAGNISSTTDRTPPACSG